MSSVVEGSSGCAVHTASCTGVLSLSTSRSQALFLIAVTMSVLPQAAEGGQLVVEPAHLQREHRESGRRERHRHQPLEQPVVVHVEGQAELVHERQLVLIAHLDVHRRGRARPRARNLEHVDARLVVNVRHTHHRLRPGVHGVQPHTLSHWQPLSKG